MVTGHPGANLIQWECMPDSENQQFRLIQH